MVEARDDRASYKTRTMTTTRDPGRGLPFVLLAAFAALAFRAWLTWDDGAAILLSAFRVGLPAALTLVLMFLLISSRVSAKPSLLKRMARGARTLSAFTLAVTLALSALDSLYGLAPLAIIPGLAVYGSLAWARPRFLAASSFAAAAAVSGLAFMTSRGLGIEEASMALAGFLLAAFVSSVVRTSVLPGEQKMKTLEEENKALWGLSYRDGLTGLYNRRYMEQAQAQLFARAVRYREQLHVLMIDIDHFKNVNDKLGHAVGDEVLKGVAATIQGIVRASDVVGRYGGEEFILYLVQSNPELTQFIANRLRDGVSSVRFPDVPWTITVSIGVAGLQDGDSVESLVERADQFLYVSKRQGRNRVSGF